MSTKMCQHRAAWGHLRKLLNRSFSTSAWGYLCLGWEKWPQTYQQVRVLHLTGEFEKLYLPSDNMELPLPNILQQHSLLCSGHAYELSGRVGTCLDNPPHRPAEMRAIRIQFINNFGQATSLKSRSSTSTKQRNAFVLKNTFHRLILLVKCIWEKKT